MIAHWMKDQITVREPGSMRLASGELVMESAYTMMARVERTDSIVSIAGGRQAAGQYTVHLQAAIPLDSVVWLPGEDTTGQGHRVISVRTASDLYGTATIYEAVV